MKSEIEAKELDGLSHQKRKRSASGNVKLEPGSSRHTHQDEGHESSVGLETYAGAHHAHQGGLSTSQGPDLGCVETTLLLLAARERRIRIAEEALINRSMELDGKEALLQSTAMALTQKQAILHQQHMHLQLLLLAHAEGQPTRQAASDSDDGSPINTQQGEKGFDPKRSQHSTFDGASDHGPGDMNAVRRLSQFLSANQADNKPGPKSSYPTSLTGITPGVHHNNNLPTTFPKLTGISQNGEHRGKSANGSSRGRRKQFEQLIDSSDKSSEHMHEQLRHASEDFPGGSSSPTHLMAPCDPSKFATLLPHWNTMATAAPQDSTTQATTPMSFSRVLDYKGFEKSLHLTAEMVEHIMPPMSEVLSTRRSQVDVKVQDEDGDVWTMKYRVKEGHCELLGPWTKFVTKMALAMHDYITLTRDSSSRYCFKIAVGGPTHASSELAPAAPERQRSSKMDALLAALSASGSQ